MLGERRRRAVGRAAAADRAGPGVPPRAPASLVLLDEPTAHLDGATEAASCVDALRRAGRGRTVIAGRRTGPALARAAPTDVVSRAPAARRCASRGAWPSDPPAASASLRLVPAPASGAGSAWRRWPACRGAAAARVALLGVGAWLIARAAQQPPVVALSVAIVGRARVRARPRLSLRYVERLVTHDAALRALADLRVRVYRRLERLAPAGLRRSAAATCWPARRRRRRRPGRRAPRAAAALRRPGRRPRVRARSSSLLLPAARGRRPRGRARGGGRAAVADRPAGPRCRAGPRWQARAELAASRRRHPRPGARAGRLRRRRTAPGPAAGHRPPAAAAAGRTARAEGAGAGALALLVGLGVWGALVAGCRGRAVRRAGRVALVVVVLLPLALAEVARRPARRGRQLRPRHHLHRTGARRARPAGPGAEPQRPRPCPTRRTGSGSRISRCAGPRPAPTS